MKSTYSASRTLPGFLRTCLRYPNLKCKTSLLLQLKLTVKSTSFVSSIGYAVAHPVLLITLIFFFTDHQLYCSRFMSSTKKICPSSSLLLCFVQASSSSSSIDKHQISVHHHRAYIILIRLQLCIL